MPRKRFLEDMACTICHSPLGPADVIKARGGLTVNCKCCGRFRLTDEAAEDASEWNLDELKWTAIAYQIRRLSERKTTPEINSDLLHLIRDRAKLPRLDELIDDFVLWLGLNTPHPGFVREIEYPEFKALLGAVGPGSFGQILQSLKNSNWIQGDLYSHAGSSLLVLGNCQLTNEGLRRFRELSKASADSRHAFMAMKYDDSELDMIFQQHFAPAVKRTGLELRRLDQGQPAGLIDDQLRVQIRTCRLLICDLTHGNRGAYWEAGFAEGLGRPVIYTCREDVFKDPANVNHPHFDTNHFVTVLWNEGAPQVAADKLVNTIRATLPGEVILQDEASG
jgi:hypothetical protein